MLLSPVKRYITYPLLYHLHGLVRSRYLEWNALRSWCIIIIYLRWHTVPSAHLTSTSTVLRSQCGRSSTASRLYGQLVSLFQAFLICYSVNMILLSLALLLSPTRLRESERALDILPDTPSMSRAIWIFSRSFWYWGLNIKWVFSCFTMPSGRSFLSSPIPT